MLYTRPQLVLLILLLSAAGAGLAVGHWRARHPDLVERLEQVDREPALTADGRAATSTGSPSAASGHERARAKSPHERRTRPAKLAAPPVEATSPDAATPPSAGRPPGPLDLNEAGAEDLSRLPGIGAGLARRIIATREADGRFASVDDLRRVRGVGRVKLQRLRPLVTVAE